MKKILIVQASFYKKISEMLLEGAISEINKAKIDYEIVDVSGALEIATVIALANKAKKYDGFVALGCVIRGQTSHYDIVANQSAASLSDLSVRKKLAIGNGIITVENEEQAIVRADVNQKNKGGFAVLACLKIMELQDKFKVKKD